MLTERQSERLPEWLDAVRQDDLLSLHTLAAGIDRDAVIAGLTGPWNSGDGSIYLVDAGLGAEVGSGAGARGYRLGVGE